MRSFGIFLLLASVMAACQHSPKIPKGIIGFEEMQLILWDLLTAESWARQTSNKDTSIAFSDEVKSLSDKTFQLHGVTEVEFNKSYDWYTSHSEVFLEMVDSLEIRKKREDSIRLIKPHLLRADVEDANGTDLMPPTSRDIKRLRRNK